VTLADALALVEINPEDAVALFNSFAEAYRDKSPALTEALNSAIQSLVEEPSPIEEPPAEKGEAPEA
jgi:hypothetical protein